MHQAIDARGELAEQEHPVVGADREIPGAVQGSGHEFGAHLAVPSIEGGIRHPRGRDNITQRNRAREDPHAVPARALGSADEAGRETMGRKSRVAARRVDHFEISRGIGDGQFQFGRRRLRNEQLAEADFELAVR